MLKKNAAVFFSFLFGTKCSGCYYS